MALDQFAIILFKPIYDGNLGSVARAMKNMGFSDLRLVQGQVDKNSSQASRMAVNGRPILDAARNFSSLTDALADCQFVVGTSGKIRETPLQIVAPRALAHDVSQMTGKIGLLFGPEDIGLTHDELKLCDQMVCIPTGSDYTSINLAQSVLIVMYEILVATNQHVEVSHSSRRQLTISADEREGFFNHMQEALMGIEYLNAQNPEHIMRDLRSFFLQRELSDREIRIFRGLWNKILMKIKFLKDSPSPLPPPLEGGGQGEGGV